MTATKAEMLEWLAPRLRQARVLPLFHFTVGQWRQDTEALLKQLAELEFAAAAVIVRSSALGEDGAKQSQAGCFLSVGGVCGEQAVAEAVEQVIASYGTIDSGHRVLIQPMLETVEASGVAFTRDPASGAAYVVVNYQDGGDTSAVTAGRVDGLNTYRWWKQSPFRPAGMLGRVVGLAEELEQLLGNDALDIEFGWNGDELVLFQVRPLVLTHPPTVDAAQQTQVLAAIANKVRTALRPHPYLCGDRTVFGVMPDWNPAEIIGIRPRPLALSLYRDLVTDSVWAYQRHNYGYRNLRSFPLMVDFHGLPYIDVRVSFNSFVPADIVGDLADRLVNYYVDRLVATPSLHDKVEFEIVLSCYSFDLAKRLAKLPDQHFSAADRQTLADSLRRLTNRVIHQDSGLWRHDSARIDELERRRQRVMAADLDTVSRTYWLLEDCKRYGTLPFAGLARAGFMATQMLRSLVSEEVLDDNDLARFMAGLDTVSAMMGRDLRTLRRDQFLTHYGHLRPGTYDILSPRYDEAPDLYFNWSAALPLQPDPQPFALSLTQMRKIERLLRQHGLEQDVVGLFDFLEAGIRGREHAKFVFTRSLSEALSLLTRLGGEHGFSVDDMSFMDIGCIHRLYAGSENVADVLAESIDRGRQRYRMAGQLGLPPLICEAEQVWAFQQPSTEPNYVTHGDVIGDTQVVDPAADLEGRILMLPNADPGYDWIFSRRIAGFVTAYGGANSHMAVRANELGLPAVIGAGQVRFDQWSEARRLRLDCLNRQVHMLS